MRMKGQPTNQAVTAWARLIRAQLLLLKKVNAALKAAELPPLAWYDVLLELHRSREVGLRQYEISKKILLPKHNLSRLIDRLENEGFVKRLSCAEDGRGNVVWITTGGAKLLKQMWRVYGAAIHESLECKLTPVQISTLGEILNQLMAGLDEDSSGHT